MTEQDRAAALRLRLTDPEFSAAVAAWEARLEALGDDFAEATPPNVWPAVERRLASSANDHAVRRWRWATATTGALAASLAAVLILRPLPAPIEIVRAPDHVMVAQIGDARSGTLLAANYDPASGMLRVRAMAMPDSELMPELWLIPADGVPRSLGLVSAQGMSEMPVPMGHRAMMADGTTLAITMEPRDGAPHRAPSSAPIAAGKISTI